MKLTADIPILTSDYLDTLLNNIEEVIIATDKSFQIQYWNKEAERVFKYSFDEVVGKEVSSVLQMMFSQDSLNDINNNLRHNSFWKGQLQYKNKSGKLLTFEVSITAIKNESGGLAGYVGLHRNITAHVDSEMALMNALAKEHQLNDMKNRFVLMASHQFRTPFSAILGSTNLIEKYKTSEQQPNRVKHINKIKEAIHHMNEILDDFLSLCRLEEGKTSIRLSSVDLQVLITDIIAELEFFKKTDQHICFEHTGPQLIKTDRRLLKISLLNIISNAIKFSCAGQDIIIAIHSLPNKTIIKIKDQGIGIGKDDQKHLFKTFYRGKNSQHVEGTGLGLHITKRYMELLGGEIKLESELGKGTMVTLVL